MKCFARLSVALSLAASLPGIAAPAVSSPGTRSGEAIYKTLCMACHETGVAHAPKFGDKAAWAPLIAEGQPVLTGHAWIGVRAMPPRGGGTDIHLNEFARAVAYMARSAGADWQDPDAPMIKRIVSEADKRLVKSIREQQAMQRELHRLSGR